MIRIVHLTDFHLNSINLQDWHNYIKDASIAKLKALNEERPITFIAFTGDLIDKGGKQYNSAEKAFALFHTEIIKPILAELGLPINHFLIIPGNHDIERNKDIEPIELGYQAYFEKDYGNISKFILNAIKHNDFTGIERIRSFKQFETSLYAKVDNKSLSIFGSSFRLKSGISKIGVCCLNSSWRCYGDFDINNLLLGEEQLISNLKFISDCDIKIALVHHPLDQFAISERSTISSHIAKDFDILLVGHVHESMTSVHTGFTGSLFINVAPSGLNDIRSDSRSFANGFTVLDFDKGAGKIDCQYFRYNHKLKEFVINSDLGKDGVFSANVPAGRSDKKITLINSVIANIQEDHYKDMDDHLIGVKADMAKASIKDAFVMPPMDRGDVVEDEETEKGLSISETVKSKSNLIFFGNQEAGKTTLLFRLVREYVDEFEYLRKIPVYIDVDELGNKEINTVIKEYLRCSSDDVKYLLEQEDIVLLLDNLNYRKGGIIKDRLNKIHRFEETYPGIQIIATAEEDIAGILPTEYIDSCLIAFKIYFIKNLRTAQIKSIMKQWLPTEDELKSDERLEKLVTSFNSYGLPSSAMSVSLFLWSMENKERKPINHGVLLEIYIEIILEKLTKENIYRSTFDFTNKLQLLAKIAQEMLIVGETNYSILYTDYIQIVDKYLKELVGFSYDPEVIAAYFVDRKLFIKTNVNRIKFTKSCFFHFFLAKRMEYNIDFRVYIMDETRYFKFPKEIDYYTALTRSDQALFEQIFERFEREFKTTDFVLEKINIDDYFSAQARAQEPMAKKVPLKAIKTNRPTQKKMEEQYDARLSHIPDASKILNKEDSKTLEQILIIMSNVLRNSEGVENLELKKKAYDSLVKYNITFMVLYQAHIRTYVEKHKKLPPAFPSEVNVDHFLRFLPFYIQVAMFYSLGTAKLTQIILSKIKQDNGTGSLTGSELEAYLSVALYGDVQGSDFPKYFKQFIKRIKNNAVRDFVFYKLVYYFYRRTKPGSPTEKIYLDLLTELRIKSQNLPHRMKERVAKVLEDGKKAFRSEKR